MKHYFISQCLAALLLLTVANVHAHIVLEQKSTTAGSYYKATFMVGHGCDGSATTGIEIEMPEAMAVVKPMPKAGWKISTRSSSAPAGMSLHGRAVTEVVNRVAWQGGPLDDAHYDEFVLLLQLPQRSGPMYFKVAQICEKGRSDWVELPVTGQSVRLKLPAPVLELQPALPAPHH